MLVSGASSGLGAHIVKHFAGEGWRVMALARGKRRLEETTTVSWCPLFYFDGTRCKHFVLLGGRNECRGFRL